MTYIVLSIENTGNAAFVDRGCDQEVARIIDGAADRMERAGDGEFDATGLFDVNGNRVGRVGRVLAVPTGDMEDGTVRLVVELGNAAFEDDAGAEVARIFRDAARRVRGGHQTFVLHDVNGNTAGSYEYREQASLAQDGVIDMGEALNARRVYMAEDGYSGIADGEYRLIVTTPDFEPGYGQEEGDAWLVNAKGEVAPGYDTPQSVREVMFRELTTDERNDLSAVVDGQMALEDYERLFEDSWQEMGL